MLHFVDHWPVLDLSNNKTGCMPSLLQPVTGVTDAAVTAQDGSGD
jgi:hypothetical protein